MSQYVIYPVCLETHPGVSTHHRLFLGPIRDKRTTGNNEMSSADYSKMRANARVRLCAKSDGTRGSRSVISQNSFAPEQAVTNGPD
eukprot:3280758-Pleurochrysis_carterae.AAC.2